MTAQPVLADTIITELLERWPQTAAIFQRYNMACVGCAVASFYTVRDAAAVYAVALDGFLAELEKVIQEGPKDATTDSRASQ